MQVKDSEELTRIAERIREQVGASPMQLPCGQLNVTLSIGAPCSPRVKRWMTHWNALTKGFMTPNRMDETGLCT